MAKAAKFVEPCARQKVAVFIDYENMSRAGLEAFNPGTSPLKYMPAPRKVSETIVEKMSARVPDRKYALTSVKAYRGIPSSEKEPWAADMNSRMATC